MARTKMAGRPGDYLADAAGVPLRRASVPVFFDESLTQPCTDLLDSTGHAATTAVADADGGITFYGPDGHHGALYGRTRSGRARLFEPADLVPRLQDVEAAVTALPTTVHDAVDEAVADLDTGLQLPAGATAGALLTVGPDGQAGVAEQLPSDRLGTLGFSGAVKGPATVGAEVVKAVAPYGRKVGVATLAVDAPPVDTDLIAQVVAWTAAHGRRVVGQVTVPKLADGGGALRAIATFSTPVDLAADDMVKTVLTQVGASYPGLNPRGMLGAPDVVPTAVAAVSPAAPTGVAVKVVQGRAVLSWDPVADETVTHYIVLAGSSIAAVVEGITSWADTAVRQNYRVLAATLSRYSARSAAVTPPPLLSFESFSGGVLDDTAIKVAAPSTAGVGTYPASVSPTGVAGVAVTPGVQPIADGLLVTSGGQGGSAAGDLVWLDFYDGASTPAPIAATDVDWTFGLSPAKVTNAAAGADQQGGIWNAYARFSGFDSAHPRPDSSVLAHAYLQFKLTLTATSGTVEIYEKKAGVAGTTKISAATSAVIAWSDAVRYVTHLVAAGASVSLTVYPEGQLESAPQATATTTVTGPGRAHVGFGGTASTTNPASRALRLYYEQLLGVAAANAAPIAALSWAKDTGTSFKVLLDASASSDDNAVTGYAWAFGDGTTQAKGASATASHTYAAAGTYDVTVTVYDADGLTSTKTVTVTAAAVSQVLWQMDFDGSAGDTAKLAVTAPTNVGSGTVGGAPVSAGFHTESGRGVLASGGTGGGGTGNPSSGDTLRARLVDGAGATIVATEAVLHSTKHQWDAVTPAAGGAAAIGGELSVYFRARNADGTPYTASNDLSAAPNRYQLTLLNGTVKATKKVTSSTGVVTNTSLTPSLTLSPTASADTDYEVEWRIDDTTAGTVLTVALWRSNADPSTAQVWTYTDATPITGGGSVGLTLTGTGSATGISRQHSTDQLKLTAL